MRKTIIFILAFFLAIPLIFAQNIEQKAKNGNVQSMYDLAQEYYSGIGRIQNQANALIWFERAANKNHIEAMYRTAQMYEKGISTKVSLRQAFNYYLLAAEKGHFISQLIVAQKLEKGEGVAKSDSRAYLWYRVCADRDETLACRKIGDYHRDGKVVLKDHSQAKYWYEKAIEKNDIEAKSSLAYLYVANEGLAPNITEAKRLNKEPLSKQIPISYFVEAMINKHEGESNYKEAFQNLQRAKQLGIKQADYPLAMMYYNGEGTSRNLPQAFSIMETLPSEYDSEIGYMMGEAYLKGDGVVADTLKAIEYYKKSADTQNPTACRAIASIYNSGYAGKQGLKQAKIWTQKADEIENPQLKQANVRKRTSKK
jgi:hypothetical protein